MTDYKILRKDSHSLLLGHTDRYPVTLQGSGFSKSLCLACSMRPNLSLCHQGRAEGGPEAGGGAGWSRVVLGGSSVSSPTTLCAFPPPHSDSYTLLVSVILPTTGPLHMLFTFFFLDQQIVIKHLLCPKHRQLSGEQDRPLTSQGLPD